MVAARELRHEYVGGVPRQAAAHEGIARIAPALRPALALVYASRDLNPELNPLELIV